MKKKNLFKRVRIIAVTALFAVFLASCRDKVTTNNPTDGGNAEEIVLNVAAYPYVPDPEHFQDTLQKAWDDLKQNDENLKNVNLFFWNQEGDDKHRWDCYENSTIDDSLDIVVFDSIFLTEYATNGQILKLADTDVDDVDGLLPFVREGVKVNGSYYGIPQMICANLFFYRSNDEAVAAAVNVDKLYEVLGDYEGTQVKLENGKGLLVDMSSGTGNVCLYLDALVDSESVYTDYTKMPDLDSISETAIHSLNELILMGGVDQVYAETSGSYDRAEWFSEGSGRAYIGYSESMSKMGDFVSQVQIGTLSLANRQDIPLFYADIAAINAAIDENKKYAALKLLNLMTSQEVMTKSIAGSKESGPLYIMPARSGCYDDLIPDVPIYSRLQEITGKGKNYVFRMGADAHKYIKEAKKILPQYLIQP